MARFGDPPRGRRGPGGGGMAARSFAMLPVKGGRRVGRGESGEYGRARFSVRRRTNADTSGHAVACNWRWW
jgi:hypothetical protein